MTTIQPRRVSLDGGKGDLKGKKQVLQKKAKEEHKFPIELLADTIEKIEVRVSRLEDAILIYEQSLEQENK